MYVFFGFGGSLHGIKVLQEGAWSNLKRVGWGKTKGTEERDLETLKVQTQNSGNMEMGAGEKGGGS